ncbi:hypothetical protein DL96DRAFT_1823522 [Flagelloscypha sp. PMI_526]|nr:hypothetical protein DL96DRAFT_1823522 [Flagelloscypha sp. PMI_526]
MLSSASLFFIWATGFAVLAATSPSSSSKNPHVVEYPSLLNVLPEPFKRDSFILDLFYQTTLPDDAPPEYAAAYARLNNASFISFDKRFETDILGSSAVLEHVAELDEGSQEMPIYLKDEGVILWNSDDLQQFKTINVKTKEIKNYTTSVPIPSAPAGTIHNGQIYLGNFGNTTVHGGFWTLDYKTGNVSMFLNNNLGLSIGADDLSADDRGGLFFTDTPSRVSRTGRLLQSPPSLYYLKLDTKQIINVDPTLAGPNGCVLSPDGKTLYVGDTGDNFNDPNMIEAEVLTAGKGNNTVYVNAAGPHTIYAYALSEKTGLPLSRRSFAVTDAGFPDGIKVSNTGHVFVAVFGGVDVYDPDGTHLGKINIPQASMNGKAEEKHVVNMVFEDTTLWIFAMGGMYRVVGLKVKGDPRLA